MIRNIILKINKVIRRKITFHKRIMFVGSLYGCLINRKQDDFIDMVIPILIKEGGLSTQAINAIRREIRYILHHDIPFNTDMLIDADNYRTKPKYVDEINRYFRLNQIPPLNSAIIKILYCNSSITKPKLVQNELVALVNGMNIKVSSNATKLPLFLHKFLWDYSQFVNIFNNNDNVESLVDEIYKLSPCNLKYDQPDKIRNDIKEILIFIKEKL